MSVFGRPRIRYRFLSITIATYTETTISKIIITEPCTKISVLTCLLIFDLYMYLWRVALRVGKPHCLETRAMSRFACDPWTLGETKM